MTDPFGDDERLLQVGFRQENGELIATKSRYDVGRPSRSTAHRRKLPERLVARLMAKAVVDLLELVDVNQQERERAKIALKAIPLRIRQALELAPIMEAGHRIEAGQPLELVRAR